MKLFEAFQSALQLIEVQQGTMSANCPCLAVFDAQNPGVLAQSIKKEEPRIIAPWESAPVATPEALITTVHLRRFSIIHRDLNNLIVSGACGLCPECESLYFFHDDDQTPDVCEGSPQGAAAV